MKKRKTTEEFIKQAQEIHGDKYNYSLVVYIGCFDKIKIICPIHGIFEQTPANHLNGNKCTYCNAAFKLTKQEFIKKSEIIHGGKFDYSLVNFINTRSKIKIICKEHGEFEQTSANHLKGKGCKKCDVDNRRTTNLEFIKKSINVHGFKYDYSLVKYFNNESKVKIICPTHGIFEQTPLNHISQKQGCPICKESNGEKTIRCYLETRNIYYIYQHKFPNCKNKRQLIFDFYLPDFNICIEYDGKQHYQINDFFGIDSFITQQNNDKIKDEYCRQNNIYLIRIRYDQDIESELIPLASFSTVII